MKKSIFIMLCLSIFMVVSLKAQVDVNKRIDSVMQLASRRGIFNGNILVAQHGKIIYQASLGYADGSRKTKLNADLLFDIGSVSKEFNGTGILILKERGLLSLEDPIAKYLPGLPAWSQQLKIKNLINYTSGIPVFSPLAVETDAEIWQNLKGLQSLQFEPGTAYIYNHYNVYLQMRIIERVSGMSYADFIRKNILIPLKMNNSVVDYPINGPRMARAFDNEFKETPYAQWMTGWIRLPVADLYRWVTALDRGQIISKAAYKELSLNFPGGESSLGSTHFENADLIWHQHQGSNSNYEALFYSSPKDSVVIVMMTNNQQMKVYGLKSAILAVLNNQPVVVPKKSVYLELREKMLNDVNAGLAYYQQLKAEKQDTYDFSFEIGDLVSTGKYLQRRKHYDDAIRVFLQAVQLQAKPADVSYAYELTGECYLKKADTLQARIYYQKALDTDNQNKNAKGMLASLN